MNNMMVREMRRAKINPKSSFKNYGAQNTRERKLREQIRYLVTYLLTPWSTVFLEKLTGYQLVKKFPAFYGIRKFITTFDIQRTVHRDIFW
jgi:hypothetical protein